MFNFFNLLSTKSITTINERLALACTGSSLQEGSIIIEVGSAYGGSAYIFTETAPTSSLYCIDIADSLDDSLIDRSKLSFFKGTAPDFLRYHPDINIDLLYIDGDHRFDGVFLDFMTLAPRVREGGLILFHDVDSFHPGVYTFVETLKRNWPACAFQQIDKLCIFKKSEDIPQIPMDEYTTTLEFMSLSFNKESMGPEDLLSFTSAVFNKNSIYIGKGKRGLLGSKLLGLNFDSFIDSDQVTKRDGKYFVFSTFYQTIRHFLISKKCISPENIFFFDDSILSYYIYNDMFKNGGGVIDTLYPSEMGSKICKQFLLSQMERSPIQRNCSNFLTHLVNHDFL
ncbi:class I SAM-dependent methyltransferase [Desulfovibrio sp. JY]|nr:class I SAM-dependent methyltransferase [Desulfovibrio sp. JY]